jgi:hypothetical protein
MTNNITLPPTGSSGTASPVVETIDTTGSGGPQRQSITIADRAGSADDVIGPINDAAAASDTAPSSLNGRLQRVAQNITSMSAALGTAISAMQTAVVTAVTAGTSTLGTAIAATTAAVTATGTQLTSLLAKFPAALTSAGALKVGGVLVTPSSVLSRPANTTAYAANELVASSTSAGSVVTPSFAALAAAGGSGTLRRAKLLTNATTGLNNVAFHIDLWSSAPTFTNGDGGAYAPASGSASWLGSMTVTGMTQLGDGAVGAAVSDVGSDISFVLASTPNIFWSLECISSGGFTPLSGQQFTFIPEILQN